MTAKKPEVWKGALREEGSGRWRLYLDKGDWCFRNKDGFATAASAKRSAERQAKKRNIVIKWEDA